MSGTPMLRGSQLPAELSSFIGRRHELARARHALGGSRVVTLSGPGGVGKTRLALRVATDAASGYADGVRLVELAAVQDPDLVADTVVASLGLSVAPILAPLEAVVGHLRSRGLLLVLDNCEHVRDAVSVLVSAVVDSCPEVGILATSRHSLDVPEEQVLAVPPLPVPPLSREPRSPEALLPYDAVRLFEERAKAVWPPFEVTGENQADVAELVRRLDGVPLAIELAAVRVRSLSPAQIVDRLGDRFALLARGDRTASPRQQSLRALLGWSHDLLCAEQQLLWQRSSVFAGGFDATDLAAVVADEHLPSHRLAQLADELARKSILVREETPLGPRFHQLESIQEYGLSKLADGGQLERFRDQHVAHYRNEAVTAAREMFGSSGVTWFRRLTAEHDDLRAALETCAADAGLAEDGAEIVAALQHHWVMTGRFTEGRHWARRLLAVVSPSAAGHAALLVVAGRLAVLQGDVDEGRLLLRQSLAATTRSGDTTWRAHALHGLALAALFWEEPAAARSMFEEALVLHRTGDDPFGVPLALVQLATLHAALGETERAMTYAEECIGLSAQSGEQWCAAMARWTQALAMWREGHTAAVRSNAREVLRLKEPFGDRLGMAMCLEVLAWAAGADQRHQEAARLLGAVGSALGSVGGGLFRTLQGGHDRCVAHTREALGGPTYDRLVSEGATLRFEDAVALALGREVAPEPAPVPAQAGPGPQVQRLTRRESEVARLVADGLTDRQIAEHLVLARRTAEGHVQRALRKLGFTSRQQLAGWVAEQRLSC
jgi:predicted ATPase/DNA-binding CsgD family transcriptional regulator